MSRAARPNPFVGAVRSAARPTQSVHHDVLVVLDNFCAAVAQYPGNALRCVRVPGFVTNLGQEYRVVVKVPNKNLDHVLLRAHVPAAGVPVALDLYDEDLILCQTPDELQRRLVDFLGRDMTKDVLRTLAT